MEGYRMKPIAVIDLFCGMGGFSQGAIEAGAKVVLAVDLWEESLKVHYHNHPGTPIKRMTLGTKNQFSIFMREVQKWRKLGYHVHIHGSPPCQALSNLSTSSRDPSEGMPLVIWFLDLVKFTKPDSYSMENVVPMRKRLPEGTPSVVLNSADYGVAQTRRRCIAGEGWEAIPTHNKETWLSVIDVLPHLTEELGTHINLDGVSDSNSRRAKSADFDINSTSGTLRNNKPTLREIKLETKPKKIRSLTIEETLTLQGFDPKYDMTQARTQKNRWTMIGNAVVPAVAKAIIGGIKQ
jgi:site-specific DNA-cytosine methylase